MSAPVQSCQPKNEHAMELSHGDWFTLKCSCGWYKTGWFLPEVKEVGIEHFRAALSQTEDGR